MRSHFRLSRGVHILATVSLLAAAACEKAKPAKDPALVIVPVGTPALNLDAKPQILFQVFGDRESPHMMPIAAVVNGAIRPIGLNRAGWKALDAQFMAPGTTYPFYAEGGNPGELTVMRDTSYTLPGCTVLKPMAQVQLSFKQPRSDPTVEFLASSGPLAAPRPAPPKMMASADIVKLARAIGHEAGKRAHLSAAEMDSLDFNARMIQTGASPAPTLVISFIDPNAGDGKAGPWTGHLFALADSGANGYEATYVHVVKGDARTVEFQRLMNHVDFTGDGADEIIVEAWRYAADNDLVVLGFRDGKWKEELRVKQNWCLDVPRGR
ncbi:MAG TPA: hypothetical protein VMH39_01520 [Gemmatimonadaceae bacterium]|nr:hypothetical protein [Gemmatimonadaceae bacterium]